MSKEAQEPAEGIVLDKDFGDMVFFTVKCDCGNSDDDISFNLEYDKDMKQVIMHSEVLEQTDWWKGAFSDSWVFKIDNDFLMGLAYNMVGYANGFLHRLRITRDVWIHGYVKYHSYTYLTEQSALNYASAIIKAINKFKK